MTAQDPSKQSSDTARGEARTPAAAPSEAPAQPAGTAEPEVQALHGYRNEVNWEGGSGRHPYGNQGRRETPSPAAGQHVPEGNRTDRSGTHQQQDQRVRIRP